MGSQSTSVTTDWSTTDWDALHRFAEALHAQLGAMRVLLFGSRARGNPHKHSDYDLIIVSPSFEQVNPLYRARGLRQVWYSVGGDGPMDLICVTPAEFEADRQQASLIAAVLGEAIDLLPSSQAECAEPDGSTSHL